MFLNRHLPVRSTLVSVLSKKNLSSSVTITARKNLSLGKEGDSPCLMMERIRILMKTTRKRYVTNNLSLPEKIILLTVYGERFLGMFLISSSDYRKEWDS